VIVGVPQFIPMAFVHSGRHALLMAVLIGLMVAWLIGLHRHRHTRLPSGAAGNADDDDCGHLCAFLRGGDVLGSWIYGLSPKYGFQYCVIAIAVTYALILAVIPFVPKQLTATADGEPNRRRRLWFSRRLAKQGHLPSVGSWTVLQNRTPRKPANAHITVNPEVILPNCLRARLGTAQAITATAHKLARVIYHVLHSKEPYTETVFHRCDEQENQRAEMRLRKHAAQLGFQLLPSQQVQQLRKLVPEESGFQ